LPRRTSGAHDGDDLLRIGRVAQTLCCRERGRRGIPGIVAGDGRRATVMIPLGDIQARLSPRLGRAPHIEITSSVKDSMRRFLVRRNDGVVAGPSAPPVLGIDSERHAYFPRRFVLIAVNDLVDANAPFGH
jgi:hypothetical protein